MLAPQKPISSLVLRSVRQYEWGARSRGENILDGSSSALVLAAAAGSTAADAVVARRRRRATAESVSPGETARVLYVRGGSPSSPGVEGFHLIV